jgi:Protein of unknown function (DUF3703)
MSNFTQKITPFVDTEIRLAHAACQAGSFVQQFQHLERAHILGQASTYHHVRVHLLMLFWGFHQANLKEVLGQCFRIVGAATKTAFGLIPSGNTGGTNISPFKSIYIPKDLQNILLKARS